MWALPCLLCALLALSLARRRPEARPVAAALLAMAALDAARLLPLPRLAAWCWLAWPGVGAALSWALAKKS